MSERLREAARMFADRSWHSEFCDALDDNPLTSPKPCNCGYTALVTALDAEPEPDYHHRAIAEAEADERLPSPTNEKRARAIYEEALCGPTGPDSEDSIHRRIPRMYAVELTAAEARGLERANRDWSLKTADHVQACMNQAYEDAANAADRALGQAQGGHIFANAVLAAIRALKPGAAKE